MQVGNIFRIFSTVFLGCIFLTVLMYVFIPILNISVSSQEMREQVDVLTLFVQTIAPPLLGYCTILFIRRRSVASHWQTWGEIGGVGAIVSLSGLLLMSNMYLLFTYRGFGLSVAYVEGRIIDLGYFWLLTYILEVPIVLLEIGVFILVILIIAWGLSWLLPKQNPVILTTQQRWWEELQLIGITFAVIIGLYYVQLHLPLSGINIGYLSFYGSPFWYIILPFPLLLILDWGIRAISKIRSDLSFGVGQTQAND